MAICIEKIAVILGQYIYCPRSINAYSHHNDVSGRQASAERDTCVTRQLNSGSISPNLNEDRIGHLLHSAVLQ
jgi:hypothetical protein